MADSGTNGDDSTLHRPRRRVGNREAHALDMPSQSERIARLMRRASGARPQTGGATRPARPWLSRQKEAPMTRRRTLFALLGVGIVIAFVLVPVGTGAGKTPMCGSRVAVTLGTPGDDVIVGTAGDDIIAGLGGDDVIYGLAGNDRICGDVNGLREGDDDVIYAGTGNDRVMGDAADIRRAGDDRIYGGDGNEVFLLGDGDRVRTGGDDWVFGGDGDVSLDGDQTIGDSPHGGDHELDGGAGFDALDGDTGFDTCVN